MSHDSALIPVMDSAAARRGEQLRRILVILVALMLVSANAATIAVLVESRRDAIATAEGRARDGARLMQEHTRRVLRATSFLLDRSADLVADKPLSALAEDAQVWRQLQTLTKGLPEPGQLFIGSAEGKVVAHSRLFPTPAVDISDRSFHTRLRDGDDFHVGALVALKAVDSEAFHVARPLRGADGAFRGVAAASFEARHFTDFYASLALGKGGNVGLFGMDGRVIIRQPDPARWVGASIAGGPVMQAVRDNPVGLIRAPSPLDGRERLVAYAALPEFRVLVVCGVALEDALAEWRDTATLAGILLAVVHVVVLALAALAFRGLRREEELVEGLEHEVLARTAEARERAAEAQQANASKTRFLAAASHDLRQPMQAAGMFVEVLAARVNRPEQDIVDKLRQCIEATQMLLTTLLDASTLEAGRVEANITVFPLAPMMANLADQMAPEAERKGLSLRVLPVAAKVRSDPVLLERMLRNLMHNALRYTPAGKVLLGCRRRGGSLVICVVDTGIGIPADQQEAIFEDFTRLGEKGAGAQRGLGLGLGVVRRMADLLGHRVEIRSVPGKGSTFAVIVPLVRP